MRVTLVYLTHCYSTRLCGVSDLMLSKFFEYFVYKVVSVQSFHLVHCVLLLVTTMTLKTKFASIYDPKQINNSSSLNLSLFGFILLFLHNAFYYHCFPAITYILSISCFSWNIMKTRWGRNKSCCKDASRHHVQRALFAPVHRNPAQCTGFRLVKTIFFLRFTHYNADAH
jgi:hypothetical protein